MHSVLQIVSTTRRFTSFDDADEVLRFFESFPADGITNTVNQAVERIRNNAQQKDRDGRDVRAFLLQVKASASSIITGDASLN